MYRSKACLPYFSSVVKNVASSNIEIKKLVYIYLLHYAESEPDLALLSINTIQKSLTDQNPQVRAMALRVMSGIKVPVISQIVSLAIKRGCGDMSPYVRKAAALAIPKCYRLDPNALPQLVDYLSILLGDKQYYVVGSAVMAFLEICPNRIDLIHKHYRALVRKLVDMDEWGQLATIRLLMIYARKCFPRKTTKSNQNNYKNESFDGHEVPTEDSTDEEKTQVLDPDLELFLKACKPLLQSRNSAVIVAVTRCFYYLGNPDHLDSAVGPLVALLRSPQGIQHIALYNIVVVCLERPQAFLIYADRFFLCARDPVHIGRLKMEVLTLIFPLCDSYRKGLILSDFEQFTKNSDKELVRDSVRAIGKCAQNDSKTSIRCLNSLLSQVSSEDGNLVAESLTVIRHLIQQDPSSHASTVIRLTKHLDTMTNPEARASIIWLVGEFAGLDGNNIIAPDVLRILAKGFTDESEPAKLQIILLAAKVYLYYLNSAQSTVKAEVNNSQPSEEAARTMTQGENTMQDDSKQHDLGPEHQIAILWRYIVLLARYDPSYDLRDRIRLYKALLANPASTQLASLLLLAPKPIPHVPSPSEGRKGYLIGSSSLVIGEDAGPNGLSGYEHLPDWVRDGEQPDSKLRDEVGSRAEYGDKKHVPAGEMLDSALREKSNAFPDVVVSSNKGKTLDDWLAEGKDEDEDESEATSEEEVEDGKGSEEGEETDDGSESESGSEEEDDRLIN